MVAISYDEVPYPDLSHSYTHPDCLATMATLLGMEPAPVEQCRVLELGCANGGNLIPMAYGLPQSEFVGIDSSASQITNGRAAIAALGLQNIALEDADILMVDGDLGKFDYIIAHGVYSWVPPNVQDKILAICRQNLASNGVAYVSYNTYPGWHLIGIARDIMRYHTRGMVEPRQRADKARDILRFMAEACPENQEGYASFLKMYSEFIDGELKDTSRKSDSALLHDELEEVNEPVHFYRFAERAQGHQLQYLADFRKAPTDSLRAEVSSKLRSIAGNIIELEQYLDFLQNRTFRQTLLCHQEISINRAVKPDQAMSFYLASRAEPVSSEPDILARSVEQFRGHDGALLSTDHPISKAAMLCLAEVWPQVLSFDALLSAARARLEREARPNGQARTAVSGNDDAVHAQVLAANLLKAYGYSDSLMELHVYVPPLVVEVADRPVASPVARYQAQSDNLVTNLRHERIRLDGFERFLLRHLDGTRDRAALLDLLLAGPVAEGVLTLQQDDAKADDPDETELLAAELQRKLIGLTRTGLLVAPSKS